jgi:multidrug resistance efflux pump
MQPESNAGVFDNWRLLTLAAVVLGALPADIQADETFLITGEVFSQQAQEIIVPLTTNWQARISAMVPEGSFVEEGDVVVEFDGTDAARQLETQRENALTELARTERDLATVEKELMQARFQHEKAKVAFELATLNAGIPESVVSSLLFDEYQLALEQADRALKDAQKQLANKRQDRDARHRQAAMDARKAEIQEQWWDQMLASFKVRARQSGYVIYLNHPWTRAKFQEGDNVQTSFQIAQIADTSNLALMVWINGVDRPRIESGNPVRIVFDALPRKSFEGTLVSVSDSGAKRREWGGADYYEGLVEFDGDMEPALMPGMSALVELVK